MGVPRPSCCFVKGIIGSPALTIGQALQAPAPPASHDLITDAAATRHARELMDEMRAAGLPT
jgi:hypothetical protein